MEPAGLIASRFAMLAALLLLAGLPLHAITLKNRFESASPRRRLVMGGLAFVAAAASVWWALESVAAMAGTSLATLDEQTFTAVLAATPLGAVMTWRLTALAAVIIAMIVPIRALRHVVAAVAGAVALVTAVWTGHAGASEGAWGTIHRLADAVHLLAAATWLGALAGFVLGAFAESSVAKTQALADFARTGSVVVALLVLSGIINALAITGWPMPLWSGWSALLGLKLGLFAAMLALAGVNRWRITPALKRGEPGALPHLRRSLMVEFALGLVVVGIVALLGVLDPSA
ncbi:putative copper resistance protein D [Novosphingobium hassiacum]|uniref:Putative copper resistance protein D n=1 Tax=Novosphingobium hassiacum TaxID=173676 RepID=A0A7W6EWQ4_9SPHN|nr:copper homeostasis membrane protein CopD [Novosphingobium hassiacum]MBB3861602.1 putative copper resistance protein D [Novosphingobium hassiacum]